MANLKDLIVNGSARILGYLYANLKGNADTATKLETARTIRTNLGSTAAAGFDGSANITPGIQGTLPVGYGGTGQTSIANIQAGKDADGNVISTTYLKQADQGNILPNFDAMPVLQTIEFDITDTSYHQICTRTNTETDQVDLNDVIYFRITVTGTSIHQVGNFAAIFPGRQNTQPYVIANMFPGTTSSTYSGIRYLRYIFPKTLNNGYGWALEVINNRNTTARHYKVEVFKTNSKFTWVQGTATTINTTYQSSGQIDIETRYGYNFNYMYGTVTQSDNATRINNNLPKFVNSTLPIAGSALLANQFTYQNGNNVYPATDKTKAIEPGYGIQLNTYAYNSGAGVGWDNIRQKLSLTSLTNIPHATLARGNPCYFRCTMDANSNILSDNYVTTSMTAGYTWYYIGIAQSATAIAIDTTQSFFLTLDSNGKLSHINGKSISGSGGATVTIRTW